MATASIGINYDAAELKIRIETKFPSYTVIDITNSFSHISHRVYTRNIIHKPNVILVAKKTPKSEFIFAIMGEPEHEFILLNRDNYLTLKTMEYNLDHTLARMLNNECSCCICFEESWDGMSCEQCGSVSCHTCILKWYNDHGCYNCPICKKLVPVVPVVRN